VRRGVLRPLARPGQLDPAGPEVFELRGRLLRHLVRRWGLSPAGTRATLELALALAWKWFAPLAQQEVEGAPSAHPRRPRKGLRETMPFSAPLPPEGSAGGAYPANGSAVGR
jgi:hypothetical protein